MKYPIGIQTFEQIIDNGFVYVDKTDLVYKLATEGKSISSTAPPAALASRCSSPHLEVLL